MRKHFSAWPKSWSAVSKISVRLGNFQLIWYNFCWWWKLGLWRNLVENIHTPPPPHPIGIIFPIWTTPKPSISNYHSHCMCKTTWINILLQIFVKLKKKDVSCSFLSLQLPWFYRLILFHSKLKLIPIVNVSDRKLGYKYLPFELNVVGRNFHYIFLM